MNKLRRRLRILARPRRLYHTLGTRLARRLGWQRLPFLPTDIDLEPHARRNFACDHCLVTHCHDHHQQRVGRYGANRQAVEFAAGYAYPGQ